MAFIAPIANRSGLRVKTETGVGIATIAITAGTVYAVDKTEVAVGAEPSGNQFGLLKVTGATPANGELFAIALETKTGTAASPVLVKLHIAGYLDFDNFNGTPAAGASLNPVSGELGAAGANEKIVGFRVGSLNRVLFDGFRGFSTQD